jgi:TIR domain/Putative peptidoglycan binding domain
VRRKIFISYRRQDTASSALALGLVQYLAREFGQRNVFIDVDMSAGTKFPTMLEMLLAECKVLLALIGPGWLNAQDDKGQRRLDNPNDWVRLEIARAINRDITVIPVRIGSTELPKKADLPEEIRSLVDYQAAVVTTEGFRNEMGGLARDIHAIPNQWPIAAVATILFVSGLIGLNRIGFLGKGDYAELSHRSISVKDAKIVLTNLGLYNGPLDQVRDRDFTEALKLFQTREGLAADGDIGDLTVAKLRAAYPAYFAR